MPSPQPHNQTGTPDFVPDLVAKPYFPKDLQDGKVCERMLIERLRSYGWRAVENP